MVQPLRQPGPVHLRRLKPGCYLVNYKPVQGPLVSFDGTIGVRVTHWVRRQVVICMQDR